MRERKEGFAYMFIETGENDPLGSTKKPTQWIFLQKTFMKIPCE
jgi:hypothetical protein